MAKENQTAITRFVRDECPNFDKHYQICIDDKPCKVLSGVRCAYFERVVLGPPDYKYKLPNYDYAKLFAQYAELTGAETETVKQRRCECGNPLKHRQRFCDDCSQKRRQKTQRESQRKFRRNQRVSA